ncbi:hypothetical protein Cgig2_014482 [Carnegiea gigantea]|uniref:Uncharacterized protein n=1 Tax=Carnegiea gigantea TaxID=171969 RepID=A0A9Q1JXX2_9CARY|nr:hypothetical protein Cgig2_014482 [Carnegiea gigantea]
MNAEVRQAPYMENVVNIYRSLDAAFSMQMLNSDMGQVREQCSLLARTNFHHQLAKGMIDASPPGNMIGSPSSFSLMGNKRVQVPNNLSAMGKLENGSGFADSVMRAESEGQDFRVYQSNPCSLIPSQSRPTQHRRNEAVAVYINHMEFSPDSSPSSGVREGAEIDSRDAGSSDDIAEKCLLNSKCAKRTVDDLGALGGNEISDSCLKKQKQQNEMCESHLPSSLVPARTTFEMNTKLGCSAEDQSAIEADSTSVVNFICAFCQTWKISEWTILNVPPKKSLWGVFLQLQDSGSMQHFANGKQVFGSETTHPNVIHIHRRCIEWAPQIFFESDTVVKNVEKELARAAKLRCNSCGLKGAALGCYAKACRRTYHVPCASQIAECRWDSDDFLMLCPSHASHKFPSEKHKKPGVKSCKASTQIYDEQKTSLKPDFWAASPTGAKTWILCGSALSADEKAMMVKFSKLCGATVTRAWNPDVTHVIAATDANGACSRTLKVLMAILNGRWILTTEWIKACMQAKSCMDEEPYEIRLDNHGCCDGPKTGRLRVLSNAPRLFSGLKFLFTDDFVPTYKHDIQDLIIAAGGAMVVAKEDMLQLSNPSTRLVVYNGDALTDTEEASHVLQRQAEAQSIALETGSRVIAHTWILDSIASCALHPFAL